MLSFLSGFLVFNLLYHIFTTLTIYGWELFSTTIPSLLRESIRCLFILLLFLFNSKQRNAYRKRRKRSRITFVILLVFSVLISYFFAEKNISALFIGIKYGFWRMFILLSATSIGFFYHKKFTNLKLLSGLQRGLLFTVILGFLWQGLKLRKPELFAAIGYELKLDDFQFGTKPPLYYLTGYEGALRRQGIFAGPNNYGYFLVAFFPLILLFLTPLKGMGKGKNTRRTSLRQLSPFQWIRGIFLLLRIGAMLMTLSRAVMLGGIVILLCCYRKKIKTLKKAVLGVIFGGVFGIIVALSLFKWQSTLNHLTNKLSSLPQIIHQPLGYGLGTSGPAIHHNGTLLPENYYFQILLDIGTVGFLLWVLVIFQIIGMQYHLKQALKSKQLTEREQTYYLVFQKMQLGCLALLVMGLVLHVFEDSMVNYLFFIVYGVLFGSFSHHLSQKVPFFFPTKKSLQIH